MRLTYVVLLKPCEIRFTQNVLAPIFDNGIPLLETLEQLENGEILSKDIPSIEVVFYQEKWEWYALNNRRLWVFQELERRGKVKYIKTKRFENVDKILDYPANLYESAMLSKQSRSFSWKGERLQITSHENTSKDVELCYTKEEGKDNSCRELVPRAKESVFSRLGDPKSPRKSFKTDRYHPYSSNDDAPSKQTGRRSSRRFSETSSTLSTSSSGSRFYLANCKFNLSDWLSKRQAFFRHVYSVSTGCAVSPSRMVACLYTCGVCFKSFKAKVSLDQHCVELHHWACVRCGRFFSTFTSLGQHKLDVRHIIA